MDPKRALQGLLFAHFLHRCGVRQQVTTQDQTAHSLALEVGDNLITSLFYTEFDPDLGDHLSQPESCNPDDQCAQSSRGPFLKGPLGSGCSVSEVCV